MLKQVREYINANPLLYWLFSVVVAFLFVLILFWAFPGPRNPLYVSFLLGLCLSAPTQFLVKRLSAEPPISPQQELAVGVLSLVAWICSLGAFAAAILFRLWDWPMDRAGELLLVFSSAAMLSLILGYAARHTWAGRWGLRLTAGWLALMVCFAVSLFLWRSVFHP